MVRYVLVECDVKPHFPLFHISLLLNLTTPFSPPSPAPLPLLHYTQLYQHSLLPLPHPLFISSLSLPSPTSLFPPPSLSPIPPDSRCRLSESWRRFGQSLQRYGDLGTSFFHMRPPLPLVVREGVSAGVRELNTLPLKHSSSSGSLTRRVCGSNPQSTADDFHIIP